MLKVAVIVTRYDLGAVTTLFDQPEKYARFLGEEDYYYWHDELLVVMPNGYGIYKAKNLPAADRAVIAKLPPPTSKASAASTGEQLVASARHAVRALAARRGITLSDTSSSGGGSSTTRDRLLIVGGAIVVVLLGLGWRFGWRRWRGRPGTMSS
jgi:hypothetical protein